jgi:kynurenine formamidase
VAIAPAAVTEQEFLSWFDTLSNWGRWGADDQLGTLNLITPEVRTATASLVQQGRMVSLSHDLDAAHPDRLGRGSVLQRYMMIYDGDNGLPPGSRMIACREYIGIVPHGSATHLDAPSHIMFDGKMYNDVPAKAVDNVLGATRGSIHVAGSGVVTRGVLLDIPALTDREWLEPGERVTPAVLEQAEERQGVRVREGDVLVMHTGQDRRIAEHGVHPEHYSSGFDASCLPWFRERGVSIITMDGHNDSAPSGFENPDLDLPVHVIGIVAMGLWILDNSAVEELVDVCRELGRYEFLFALAPLKLVGATSSPVNPIAVF